MNSEEKFWAYDVTNLFKSYDLIPKQNDSLAAKLNAITRLAVVACSALSLYRPILGIAVMMIVVAMTMCAYSLGCEEKSSRIVEGFEEVNSSLPQVFEFMKEYNSTRYPDINKIGFPTTQKRFCNDAVLLQYGPSYVSANQSLVGGPNPKTKVPPLVVAPSHDLDSWKTNDLVVQSGINKSTNFDKNLSGYGNGILPAKCKECMYVPCMCDLNKKNQDVKENFRDVGRVNVDRQQASRRHNRPGEGGYFTDVAMDRRRLRDQEDDDDYDSGYNSSANGIDDKVTIDPCFESPRRDNLITQTLQPGVYQKSHIGEPIQSNIGISYVQEWGPTEVQETSDSIKYTMRDPKNVIQIPAVKEETISQDVSNVYDPRFTGYGTSYRAYVDKLTGRGKFFYDDVDSITMPNYITRSKVDVFPWADTYGPDKIMSESDYSEHRQLANNAFTDSTITFRTEMQERLMRKRNAEMWQRRVAPISTMGRLGSSMKSCM
jgi:hypothetical protein